MSSRLDRLTEAQREVLRSWRAGLTAKEIGRGLGITHYAVNERLRSARRALDVDSSDKAARLLAEAEQPDTYNRLVYERPALAEPGAEAMMGWSDVERNDGFDPVQRQSVHEKQLAFEVLPGMREWKFNGPWRGGRPADFDAKTLLAWTVGLAALLVVMVSGLITIAPEAVALMDAVVRTLS